VLSRLKFLVPAVSVDFPPAFVRFCTPAHLVLFPIVSDPTPFSVIKCGSGNGKWFIPPVSVCFHYCARQGGRVTGRGRFTRAEKSATEFLSPLHTPFGGSVALYLGARGVGEGLIFSLSRKLTLSWKVQPILTPLIQRNSCTRGKHIFWMLLLGRLTTRNILRRKGELCKVIHVCYAR
jgi:hypothetical protein